MAPPEGEPAFPPPPLFMLELRETDGVETALLLLLPQLYSVLLLLAVRLDAAAAAVVGLVRRPHEECERSRSDMFFLLHFLQCGRRSNL